MHIVHVPVLVQAEYPKLASIAIQRSMASLRSYLVCVTSSSI